MSVFVIDAERPWISHLARSSERAAQRFRVLAVAGGPLPAADEEEAQDAGVAPLLLRVEKTAEALDVSTTTVKRLIRDGALPAVHVYGSTRVPVAGLRAYVERMYADTLTDQPKEPE